MQDNKIYVYSPSPHVKKQRTTKGIMIDVCIALLPACVMGIVYFGYLAALILGLAVISAVISEYVYLLISGKTFREITRQFDFTSCVTGLLIGMSIGINYPLYAPVLGSAFAIIVVKMLFGGTGKNVVNPAVTGRIFIFISFQAVVSTWVLPSILPIGGTSVSTSATALGNLIESGNAGLSNLDLLLGTGVAGCIGETCKLALIVGGIYLAVRKVINPLFPVIYIAVTGLFSVALSSFEFGVFLPSILSGGLILGAIFMATDYTTTPNTFIGNLVYFVMLGLITAGLRFATKMETVSFAILLMNLLLPLIEKFTIRKPFGYTKQKKIKEAKHD